MSAPNHPGKLGQLKMKIDFTIAYKVRRYADVWVTPGKREYHSKDDDQESGYKKCLLKAKARARGAMLHLRVFESRDHKGEPIVVSSPAELWLLLLLLSCYYDDDISSVLFFDKMKS